MATFSVKLQLALTMAFNCNSNGLAVGVALVGSNMGVVIWLGLQLVNMRAQTPHNILFGRVGCLIRAYRLQYAHLMCLRMATVFVCQ